MITITINVKFQCAVIYANARLQEERYEGLEAIYRADIQPVGVPALDAGFGDRMCHEETTFVSTICCTVDIFAGRNHRIDCDLRIKPSLAGTTYLPGCRYSVNL